VQHFPAAGDAAIYRSLGHFSSCSRSNGEICSIRDIATGTVREKLFAYACVAVPVLLAATVLSTYKPRGRTPYGARMLDQRNRGERQPQQAI
jgi:hypothetical protein